MIAIIEIIIFDNTVKFAEIGSDITNVITCPNLVAVDFQNLHVVFA